MKSQLLSLPHSTSTAGVGAEPAQGSGSAVRFGGSFRRLSLDASNPVASKASAQAMATILAVAIQDTDGRSADQVFAILMNAKAGTVVLCVIHCRFHVSLALLLLYAA